MPFNPTTIAGLQVWWDASQLTGFADNDPVGTWPDSTGNGRSAAQAAVGRRPLFKAAFQNGLPVLQFDGVDDLLATTYAPALGNFTVAIAFNATGVATTKRLLDKDYLGGFWLGKGPSTGVNKIAGGIKEDAWPYGREITLVDSAWHVLASRRSGTVHYLEGDGGAVSVSGTVVSTLTNTAVFSIGGLALNYLACYIGEILIWDQGLSASDLDTITGYLAWKWGTQANLPAGHPYKTAPPGGASTAVSAADGPDEAPGRLAQIRQRDFLARQRDDEEVLEAVAQAFTQLCR